MKAEQLLDGIDYISLLVNFSFFIFFSSFFLTWTESSKIVCVHS